jgi:hypothetical protein
LRILFSVRNQAYVRHYDSVLRALSARGHDVWLAMQPSRRPWPPHIVALAQEGAGIRLTTTPETATDPWWELASRCRETRFYLRFLQPEYRGMAALLDRARVRAPRTAVRLAELPVAGPTCGRLLGHVTDAVEKATRSAAPFHDYLRECRPDVAVFTPLVVLKTTQLDLARAAVELGIRNVFAVASWDHLSSKGILNLTPQQVFVWNEVQKREASELHGVDPDRIVVTGSHLFDEWFGRRPATTRETFCDRVGLRSDRPLLLYVCSSLLEGSPPEASFVLRWARHLRESGHPALRDCGILVRPHPRRAREWRGIDLASVPGVACWPPGGEFPVDARSKADYFDSLYHADAVVGLNTSAMIEAAILGRSVHTVLLPEFRESQEGTVHFRYLLDGPDALLRSTRSLGDHARDLAAALERTGAKPARSEQFVHTFLRPHGLMTPATTVFVDALEALAAAPPPAPAPAPAWTRIVRPMLAPFGRAAAARARRLQDARSRQRQERLLAHRRRKAAEAVPRVEQVR